MSIEKGDLECMILDESAEPRALRLSLLEKITKGFSDELVIGRGGFAIVYRGILENGDVAVKKLTSPYMYEKEFHREIECLLKVKHRNIVRFLGYCADTQGSAGKYQGKFVMADERERLLCFEYVPNGSLHDYITDASCGLEWRIRYRIIRDICEGLLYLHQNNICHLDLKPGNILLDKNMVAKITDFGLSRCFEEDETKVIVTKLYGTIGYLAPEFTASNVVTHKFDLYSLGCIIMEILTGKKGYEDIEKILESWSNRLGISQDNLVWEQIKVCAEIAMDCNEFDPKKRPCSMKHLIDRLVQTEGDEVETEGDEAGKRHPSPSTSGGEVELHPCQDGLIPKVRAQLLRVAGELFRPHAVAIGPYHQNAVAWLLTPEKEGAVQFLRRRGFDLSALQEILDGVQSRARGYYTDLPDEDHGMDSQTFCRMLLHDGCYLLSLFFEFQFEEPTVSDSSHLEATVSPDNTVLRDVLYLLENQIPLFVMDEILNYLGAHITIKHYLGAQREERSALMLMCLSGSIKQILQKQLYISKTMREAPSTSHHLLDLVYSYFTAPEPWTTSSTLLPPYIDVAIEGHPTGQWRRATEYCRYADLGFKPRAFGAGEEWTILDVQLVGGILSIPLLRVDGHTWTLLRNLMALEEEKEARPVTAYCLFMSQLSCTTKDVQLLRSAKVIESFLGSDEAVAQGFASLCHGVVLDIDRLDRNYLKPMWHAMEKRCSVWTNNIMGFFR